MTEPEITVELDNSHNSNSQHENGNNSNEENNEDLEAISGSEQDGSFGSFDNRGSSQNNNDGDNESLSSGRKMFECDVCNMKFSNGANMRRHKMRHTGVKPYECRICQKRFFRKDHLAEHFTTHTKTLPYHCPICNRGFQRQIAMRAHFQNEHVGQNDMIKSCPLCSYRAGSMKNLRVHFFNSHGIDLDNPDPRMLNNPAVAAASLMSGGEVGIMSTTNNHSGIPPGGFPSDSGDSIGNRSADNATPPMHFLTPHVEISMADASSVTPKSKADSSFASITMSSSSEKMEMNGDGTESPCSPQSGDSDANTNQPSNSLPNEVSPITPSVSLIPIKQEPEDEKSNGSTSSLQVSNSLSNLMKSSPLKTLLREDLKRRTGLTFSTAPSRSSSPPEGEWGSSLKKNFSLKCLFCGILFPDQTLYFLHKGCHCESNPWRCNICGEQLFNVYEFNSHLLSKIHQ